ncbi:MAG: hypothetical protein NZM11_04660 [Anaerolineales bacterium]|nr:hypothetical protein [Anaerolineales bacterium]
MDASRGQLYRVGIAWWLLLLCAACTLAPTDSTTIPTNTPLPTPTTVPTAIPNTLFVDAAYRLGPISPLVYGTNYGPWITVPYELKSQAIAARLTYLRFPGGAYGDNNDLQTYQVDQFIALARELGAEPAISVRLKKGTPEQAAAWVNYTNITHDYNVRYWSIGNEPSLYAATDRMDYDTQRYNAEWREFALAMEAVDPNILLVGPDTHQFTADPGGRPKDVNGRDWLREFLLANGDLVDIVAIHRYPFPKHPGDPPPTIDDLRANSREWEEIIPALRALIRETTGRDLPVAVTEVNSNWSFASGGEATPDSFYNAIWWADVLGRLIRQGVFIVAHFNLQTNPGRGGWGLLARTEVRPTYYVYRLYQHFGDELIYASSDEPDISLFAARRADGALTLMLVNLGPQAVEKPLMIANFVPAASAETYLLDEVHAAELVAPTPIGVSTIVRLPARSVTLLIVPPS